MPAAAGFPGFDDIYTFADPGMRNFRVEFRGHDVLELLRAGSGSVPFPEGLKAFWYMGVKKAGHVIWGEAPLLDAVARGALKGFTGWLSYPIAVVGPDGQLREDYEALVITGHSGPLDRDKSEWVRPHYRRGKYFDPTSWDGSDLFVPEGSFERYMVGDVHRALNRHRVKPVDSKRSMSWFGRTSAERPAGRRTNAAASDAAIEIPDSAGFIATIVIARGRVAGTMEHPGNGSAWVHRDMVPIVHALLYL